MDTNFDEKISRVVSDLIETSKDGMKGYQTAAENVENPEIKSELSRLSQQRASFVNELESSARQYGITAKDDNTIEGLAMDAAGAVHRGWINLKTAITGNSSNAILSECENGDAAALKAYEQALSVEALPIDIKEVIEKQHAEILGAKNRVTALKASV